MLNKPLILLIDDEMQIRRFLRISLEANDFRVVESATGKDGIVQAAMMHPEIIILDLGLPDINGVDVLKEIRQWSSVPILILSVHDREQEKILALDAGADDYVTKPFSMGELIARLRVALRHGQPIQESSEFKNAHLFVDLVHRVVKVNDQSIKLTVTEYSLLLLFIRHAGKVLTHNMILKEIWGSYALEHLQYLRVYVAQLRKKIELDPEKPKLFLTESGVGYRMVLVDE